MTENNHPSITSFVFQDDGTYPNNRLPLVLFKQINSGTPTIDPAIIETLFHGNNWVNSWRNGLYPFHHYHSTAHEVLGVYSGWVKAQLGGPSGRIFIIEAGDVAIVPAGVAHKNVDQSHDFKVLGAYPAGQIPDMKYGKRGERPGADENIKSVRLPANDPVYGKTGPLMQQWNDLLGS
jgi:uncharacterized protein YjlB